MIEIEIEKKYLIAIPKEWQDFNELFDNLIDIKRITQTYLEPKNGVSGRVRKTVEGFSDNLSTVFHYNTKKKISPGVNEEDESEISEEEYLDYLKDDHPEKKELRKIRYVFDYRNQIFELDIFNGRLSGLAILEIELKKEDEEVHLPPFLQVVKEVTKEEKYNNFNLASK